MTKALSNRTLSYAKGRAKNVTPFGRMLYSSISHAGMSASLFAGKIDLTSGFLSSIYQGKKKPPLYAMDRWCKALDLHGTPREEFLVLASIEHIPPLILGYLLTDSDFCSATYNKWMGTGETDHG